MKVYIDGQYYDKSQARISVFDHGLLYGDGVFEGIRLYHGKIFLLEAHIERLFRSAQAILLKIPVTQDVMGRTVEETVRINRKSNGYIRLIVTRGQGALGIDPSSCRKPTVVIIVDDLQLYPSEYYKKGIRIITSSSRRMSSDCLDPRIKSLNYLNNILAKLEARQAGCLEAVMMNREGFITECTADNLFLVKSRRILTPAACYGALEGITRKVVIDIATSLGIASEEAALTRYDLHTADECFITGTGAEIVPVTEVDGRVIGNGKPGEVTTKVNRAFADFVKG
ncbi:MAG: branched-chain-amino-acid transaminase [Nitrospirota bacterium]